VSGWRKKQIEEQRMNEWDRDNLNFIMACSDDDFKAWFDQATEDDISYALELIKQSRGELLEQEFEVHNRESERLMLKHGKYPEASAILSKFLLKSA
jgi:hypothetical protein